MPRLWNVDYTGVNFHNSTTSFMFLAGWYKFNFSVRVLICFDVFLQDLSTRTITATKVMTRQQGLYPDPELCEDLNDRTVNQSEENDVDYTLLEFRGLRADRSVRTGNLIRWCWLQMIADFVECWCVLRVCHAYGRDQEAKGEDMYVVWL